MAMKLIAIAFISYLIGTVNPAALFARRKGFNIHEAGSANAGSANAYITMGTKVAAIVLVFDLLKAFLAVKLSCWLFPDVQLAFPVATVFVVLGHVFPFYLHFHGGKGTAALGGAVMGYSPLLFLIVITTYFLVALISNYLIIGTIVCATAVPFIYLALSHDIVGSLVLCVAVLLVVGKHIPNVRRIREGKEFKFRGIWNRSEEIARLQETMTEDEYELAMNEQDRRPSLRER